MGPFQDVAQEQLGAGLLELRVRRDTLVTWLAPSAFSAIVSHIFWRNCVGTCISVFDERAFTRSVASVGGVDDRGVGVGGGSFE